MGKTLPRHKLWFAGLLFAEEIVQQSGVEELDTIMYSSWITPKEFEDGILDYIQTLKEADRPVPSVIELPTVESLADIVLCGYYKLGNSIVIADNIGKIEFKDWIMPPIQVMDKNSTGYHSFKALDGIEWRRECLKGIYGKWIKVE